MEQVILAFENESVAYRIKEVLEATGTAGCIFCKTADQVRRAVRQTGVTAVICGFKLGGETSEHLFHDLPPSCAMLVLAPQNRLELLQETDIFRLAAPASKGDLLASVRLLLQVSRRLERAFRPHRSKEEVDVVNRAKRLLMDRNGLSEEQAHRFLQRASMNSGVNLTQTARMVLDGHN